MYGPVVAQKLLVVVMDWLLAFYLPQDNTRKVHCTPDIKGPSEKTEKV